MKTGHVVVLRSPSQPISEDPYQTAFQSCPAVEVSHVETLDTNYVKEHELQRLVAESNDTIDGVIITSKRAAHAWLHALAKLSDQHAKEQWHAKAHFVVGQPTKNALSTDENRFTDVRGEGSGTGERVARYIVEQYASAKQRPKLLYLVGDKNRDTIETILGDAGIAMVRQQVYETRIHDQFESQLTEALSRCTDEHDEIWLVFFAPSVTDAVFDYLKRHDLDIHQYKVATIGPVTTEHIRNMHKLTIDIEARTPDPAGLLASLQESWSDSA